MKRFIGQLHLLCMILACQAGVVRVITGDPDGNTFGAAPLDTISFYGVVPMAQKSSSVQGLAGATVTSSASFFGASSVNATSWTAQKCAVSNVTGTTIGALLAEVVDTLVGLGIWKGKS